ncbi:LOW QUALITY PROTEIN: hypothetical protein Bca101_059225 [Brassica carinata]
MASEGSGASRSFGMSGQDGSRYANYHNFWDASDSVDGTGDSGPRSMEGVERAHSEENVNPETWRLSISPPNSQHAESEPFIGPQRPCSSRANSEGSTSRRNNPGSAEAAEPAPADEDKPLDPTLSMVHDLLS